MTMLVGIAKQQVKHTLVILIARKVTFAGQPAAGSTVNGKDVQIDATQILQVHALDERRAAILNLGKGQRIHRIVLGTHHFIRLRQPFFTMDYQLVVVRTRHGNIKVVIPRDEPLVTNSSYHRSSPHVIMQTMLPTSLVDGTQNLENS